MWLANSPLPGPQYVHDGSERLSDAITVVGVAGGHRSAPATVGVTVVGVNDEPPVVVNNTGVAMWVGDTHPITSAMLGRPGKWKELLKQIEE